MTQKFDELVSRIQQIGLEHHAATLLENTRRNAEVIRQEHSIRECKQHHAPCIIASAGPSLYRQRILARVAEAGFTGTLVATDGAYIQCLKAGLKPDWVVTIDPHPTRIVRWFGDKNWHENSKHDDYFRRQDLAEDFRADSSRANAENIRAVDAAKAKLVICSASPANVVERTSGFERFWFAPLVDNPDADGLTRTICAETGLPALNTGGTVGTAAWAFAHCVLKSTNIAVVGMDFGYPMGTPLEQTQSWHMLQGDASMYPQERGYWGEAFTDPTYYWYRRNMLDLLKANKARIINCSGEGLLYGPGVGCMDLEQWLAYCS